MWIFIVLGAIGVWAIATTIAQLVRDGYGPVPTKRGLR
ncbi:hypothetical protein CLV54_3496 [Compostimonas suwonensis]|uniref:Uncharacterized protein n=1 Tax=Compostimonas suwonensis TaxID=1048394 RepID=A0A2M9BB42_9MICO|nr:hypothetical protein CLV54_3496 [Compostimonas suwonensis]